MCDYTLTVCVKRQTPRSERMITELRRIFSEGLVDQCELEIVDFPEAPQTAGHQIKKKATVKSSRRSRPTTT